MIYTLENSWITVPAICGRRAPGQRETLTYTTAFD